MSLEDIHMNTKDLLEKKRLDAGGFGTISLCFHKKHGYVVLKKVYTGPQRTEYNVSLLEEGRIMRKLQHDRVVKLLGVILEDGNYSLVMEYVDRGNMMKVLQNLSLPLSVRGRFVLEITEGMLYLHEQGFVHKDLKPENILVDRDFHIKIADLGVASFKSWSRLTQEETVRQKQMKSTYQNNAGTLFYMAPEHLCCVNTKPVEKSDVYSFGIVIWAIFANKEPYENAINENHICFGIINGNRPDIKEIADKCPVEIIDLMKQCWDEDSKKRPTFAEISERYEPFYYQNLGKNIEEDLKNLKKMWPESNELPHSMESLQIDAVPEDTSNGQIDQPNSLHSSQGPMTNEVNEALVAASPENWPVKISWVPPAPPDNLERKLQHEYNYHAFGSRMDKETAPSAQYFSVKLRPGIVEEWKLKVFSDPFAKPSPTSQQSELYPRTEKAASNTNPYFQANSDPNFWPQPAATTPKWGNADAFYRPNPNSLPVGNPVDAYGLSSASNLSLSKPPVPESGQNWQPQTNVNWYSKNADTDTDQPNSLHSSQGPMTNEVNEALVAASPENWPVKISWVPPAPPDNLERKLQHEYNYHAFGSRMDKETAPSAQYSSVKLSPEIKEERKLKIYPYSFAKPSPTSQQSELYPRTEKAASNTNPYFQANSDPNFWPQPAATTPKWGNADAFYRPNPNSLPVGNPVDAYGLSSASNLSLSKPPVPESGQNWQPQTNVNWYSKNADTDTGYRDSTSFTRGTFAYHPSTSRVSSVPYTDDSIKYNISNSSGIQIGSYNHMKIEEQNSHASTSPVAMEAIYADYEAKGVFDNTTVLTEKHLNLVREKLAKQWKHCARKLGFSDPEIDEIDHDYERDGLKEKVYQMLLKWVMREGSKGATVGKLAKALFGCQRLDLLRSLMQIQEE